ncbi:MAG: hypothetical protein ACI8RD_002193 [Bacillariaceae sp.]
MKEERIIEEAKKENNRVTALAIEPAAYKLVFYRGRAIYFFFFLNHV